MIPTPLQGLRVARAPASACRAARGGFRDDLVELVDTPVDPAVLADAVRTAASRSGLGSTVLPLAGSGIEAA